MMGVFLPKKAAFRAFLALFLVIFSLQTVVQAAEGVLLSPVPVVTQVGLSAPKQPLLLKGLRFYPDNPTVFDFMLDQGDLHLEATQQQEESMRLVRYFLATLTTPSADLWVNLSPAEPDRIVNDTLADTEIGRDLLAQDYLLKQITASLLHPDNPYGKQFWAKVYADAFEQYGTTEIPVETFHKVWIVPKSATIFEQEHSVYVQKVDLDVMLERDYVVEKGSTFNARQTDSVGQDIRHARGSSRMTYDPITYDHDEDDLSSEVMRSIIIPAIRREVNEGDHFTPLRQIVYALVLAKWLKQNTQYPLWTSYIDTHKTAGIDIADPTFKQHIYEKYVDAYQHGVVNVIEEEDVARHYFSGGFSDNEQLIWKTLSDNDTSMTTKKADRLRVELDKVNNAAMAVGGVGRSSLSQQSEVVSSSSEYSFAAHAHKHVVIVDDNKNILSKHTKVLQDHFRHIYSAVTPQEGLVQVRSLMEEGIPTTDIVVLTDFQFSATSTALDLINPLRVPEEGQSRFEGPIMLVSGSLISQSQIPGFREGTLSEEVQQQYGLRYLEKNGAIDFREQLLSTLAEMLNNFSDPKALIDQPLVSRALPELSVPQALAYLESGINDWESVVGETIDALKTQLASINQPPDQPVFQLLENVRERLTFGNINRALSMERRTHDYRNALHEVLSDDVRDLQTLLSGITVQQHDELTSNIRTLIQHIEAMREYARFLNHTFFHMRGLAQLNALQPMLQEVIAQYQHEFEGKTDAVFDPQRGIARALAHLEDADEHMQRGIIEDAMLEWGRLYGQYQAVQDNFNQVLGATADLKTLGFMDRFSDQLNQFFGQYIQRFGHHALRGIESGSTVGRLVVVRGTEEEVLAQLASLTDEDIVVLDQDYTRLTMASTKARGFIFGREGAGHIATRARALQVPLVSLPNAVAYLKQFDEQNQWIAIENQDGRTKVRFIDEDEKNVAPLLQKSVIKAEPVVRDLTGPLMLQIFNDDLAVKDENDEWVAGFKPEDLAQRIGYKAANLYYNYHSGVGVPFTNTLTNRFWHELLKENSSVSGQLHQLFDELDRTNPQQVAETLTQMRALIQEMVVSQEKKEMIWNSFSRVMVPYFIFRLTTGAEDLEKYPGVGAGVYGSKELVPWAVEVPGSMDNTEYQIPQENKDLWIDALLEVYASYWSLEAFADRERYGIDHWAVGVALEIQEYYYDAPYSVQVHTVDPESKDENIVKIELMPGSGRGMTDPDPRLQGDPLTVYFDKSTRKMIQSDDSRTQFHPKALTKTHRVSLKTGQVEELVSDEELSLDDLDNLEEGLVRIFRVAVHVEEYRSQAQDMEGVMMQWVVNLNTEEKQWDFTHHQSRAQAGIDRLETKYIEDRVWDELAKNVNLWLDEVGRDEVADLNFYKGASHERVENVVTRRYEESHHLSHKLNLGLGRGNHYMGITWLYKMMSARKEFADVKEGIMRRLFFYAASNHEPLIDYLKKLLQKDPQLFAQILPYALPPLNDETIDWQWYFDTQSWLVGRFFLHGPNMELFKQVYDQLSFEDRVALTNQLMSFGMMNDTAAMMAYQAHREFRPLVSKEEREKMKPYLMKGVYDKLGLTDDAMVASQQLDGGIDLSVDFAMNSDRQRIKSQITSSLDVFQSGVQGDFDGLVPRVISLTPAVPVLSIMQ